MPSKRKVTKSARSATARDKNGYPPLEGSNGLSSAPRSAPIPPPAPRDRSLKRTAADVLIRECRRAGIVLSTRAAPSRREELAAIDAAHQREREGKRRKSSRTLPAKRPREVDATTNDREESAGRTERDEKEPVHAAAASGATAAEQDGQRRDSGGVEMATNAMGARGGRRDGHTAPVTVTRCVPLPLCIGPHEKRAGRDAGTCAVNAFAYALSNGCYGALFPADGSCLQVLRDTTTTTATHDNSDGGGGVDEYVLYVNPRKHSLIFAAAPISGHGAAPSLPAPVSTSAGAETEKRPQKRYILIPLALVDKFRSLLEVRRWWRQPSCNAAAEAAEEGTAPVTLRTVFAQTGWHSKESIASHGSLTETDFGFRMTATSAQAAAAKEEDGDQWYIPYVCSVTEEEQGLCVSLANELTPYPGSLFYED